MPLEWNEQLQVVATELETSERKVFNKYSNVDLVDALAASSALRGCGNLFLSIIIYIMMVAHILWKILMS